MPSDHDEMDVMMRRIGSLAMQKPGVMISDSSQPYKAFCRVANFNKAKKNS